MTEAMEATTLSRRLTSSQSVTGAIDTIVHEAEQLRSRITGLKDADPGLKADYDDLVKRAGESRGRALMLPYVGSGIGNGVFVELADGSIKYDLTQGIGPNFFGHSNPELLRVSLEAATQDIVMQGHLQMNVDAVEFTELLVKEAGRNSGLKHAFLSTSGAMANESALKLVMQKNSPAERILAFQDCFMGRSLAMTCIGDNPAFRDGLPNPMKAEYMPFYSPAAAKRMSAGDQSGQTRYIDMCVWHLEQYIARYPGQYAAFAFELVQGEGGYNTAPREFFTSLMDVCKDKGIAIWIDEIQTFGRTLEMFCFDALNLGSYVDVVSCGKMTQACATLYTEEYSPRGPLLSGTFLGSTVALQVGKRMMERLREGGYYGKGGVIDEHNQAFVKHAKALAEKHPEWFPRTDDVPEIAGGFGGMMRFTPFGGAKDKVSKFCMTLFDEGALAIWCGHGPYHARFLPPLGCMSLDEWPKIFAVVERALAKTANG